MSKLSKVAFAAMVAFALVGCSEGVDLKALNMPFAGTPAGQAPRSIRIANRQITVQGPEGYCIDKATKHAKGGGGFVVLGNCAAISGNSEETSPRVLAVLSVSVIKAQSQGAITLNALRAHFRSEAGQAVLAQSGSSADAGLLSSHVEDGALILHAVDTSSARSDQLSDGYWRGMFPLDGHLVSLTVSALDSYPISESEGFALMQNFVKTMQNANLAR